MVRKYYPFGYSGYQFLERNNTRYIQSELLPDNSIRVIECDIEEKWMKVKERENHSSDWINVNLSELYHCNIIDLNDKGERWEGDSLNSFHPNIYHFHHHIHHFHQYNIIIIE